MTKNTDKYNDLAYKQLEANKGNVSVSDEGAKLVDGLLSGEEVYEDAPASKTKPSLRDDES